MARRCQTDEGAIMKAADYVPKNRADARAYAQFIQEEFDREDWPPTRPRRKRRSPSLARLLAHAKKIGADVILNADGSRTIVTSSASHEAAADKSATGNELDKWMAKHAH
jgi:hypothetical protein